MCVEKTQKYEVLRMLQRENEHILSMDYAEGMLLICAVQEESVLQKEEVLRRIYQLTQQLVWYQKKNPGRSYRYLNPYSVVLTKEETLLLDMEAESNQFVVRNMQKRAMRKHFVRSPQEGVVRNKDFYDLGQTVRFLLACADVSPFFSPGEIYRINRYLKKTEEMAERGGGERGEEVLKELPKARPPKTAQQRKHWKMAAAGVLILCLAGVGKNVFAGKGGADMGKISRQQERKMLGKVYAKEAETAQEEIWESASENGKTTSGQTVSGQVYSGKQGTAYEKEEGSGEMERIRQLFLENTSEGNQEILRSGEEVQAELLYYLAVVYEREGKTEKAIAKYKMLCAGDGKEKLQEDAFCRKAALEEKEGKTEQAKATYKEGMEKFPESERLQEKAKKLSEQKKSAETEAAQ